MRLLVIVGTQLRHQYFLATLAEKFPLAGVIEYQRTLVQPPKLDKEYFRKEDLEIEKKHLGELQQSETSFFKSRVDSMSKNNVGVLRVAGEAELNSIDSIEWVRSVNADVMIDYGSGILRQNLLGALPHWKINLHGGISPYYKGSATLFWPFYFQQPELAGATFHLLSEKIDGGDILQHVRPRMFADDNITDIMCRCIVEASDIAVMLLKKLQTTGDLELFPQKGTGKLFLEKDYKPSCVRVVRELVNGGLIARYLEHKKVFDSDYQFVNQIEK